MSVVSIHGRDAGGFAKSALHHLLQQGDVAGWDSAGRTVLQLSIDDWLLEELCAFDSDAAELEDTDGELEADQEIDGPPVTPDIVRTKRSGVVSRCWPALVCSPCVSAPQTRVKNVKNDDAECIEGGNGRSSGLKLIGEAE